MLTRDRGWKESSTYWQERCNKRDEELASKRYIVDRQFFLDYNFYTEKWIIVEVQTEDDGRLMCHARALTDDEIIERQNAGTLKPGRLRYDS